MESLSPAGRRVEMYPRVGVLKAKEKVDCTMVLHPVGRVGEAQEFANVAEFFACEDGTFITGVALPVDGG